MEREYITSLPDGTVVRWKSLTLSEYRKLQRDFGNLKGSREWLLYEAAAVACILDAEQPAGTSVEFGELLAGTVQIIGYQVLEKTGFVNKVSHIRERLSDGRGAVLGDWYEEAKAYILSLFRVTEEEVNSWDVHKLMRYAARCEILLGKELPVVDYEEEQRKKQRRHRMTDVGGQRIPLLTKEGMADSTPIDVTGDIAAMRKEELSDPQGEFNLNRLRSIEGGRTGQGYPMGQHPARKALAEGRKIHPLRQRQMKEGMI